MREEDSSWFSKREDELPSPKELMALSQSLITPDLALALAFNISNPHHAPPQSATLSSNPNSYGAEFDSPELSGTAAGGSDEPARTLKRSRLVWTPQLHKCIWGSKKDW